MKKEILLKLIKKTISKMDETPKNGVRMVVFLSEVDFRLSWIRSDVTVQLQVDDI